MLQRFLELQPAVYAALMDKGIRTKGSDVATLSDADITMAEDIMACLLPLKAITTVLCTERMPTVSIILPLQKKLLSHDMVSKDDDSQVIKQMKGAIATDLASRYRGTHEFLQECTALDPRFKATCLTDQEKFDVYHRLSILAANVQLPPVKLETGTGTATPTPPIAEPPPLPVLPEVQSSDPPGIEEAEVKPVNTTPPQSEPAATSEPTGGLASILGDVIIVKEEKGPHLSVLERAGIEVDRFKGEALIPMAADLLQWWKEHQWQFPLLAQLARKRMCVPATSVPSERVFSTAGDIVTAQRAALCPETVDMLIFLKKKK